MGQSIVLVYMIINTSTFCTSPSVSPSPSRRGGKYFIEEGLTLLLNTPLS